MYVKSLDGPDDSNSNILMNPEWEDIESAIKEINGIDKTLLILGTENEESHLAIGGGSGGKYILYITYDNLEFNKLINPKCNLQECCQLVCGGQAGDYPANQCVDIEMVFTASKTFAEKGILEPSLVWDKD